MPGKPEKADRPTKTPVCSICGKPVDPAFPPFCSKRCANVDLHRWLNGSYAIAGESLDEDSASRPDDAED
ncbi:DNA gyrase inhibitor YacG [uncultured Rhodoblastus sp.]|uniref:DNA gyrase inhibitor YacG n=1 Tax=uncultured Rhodoblastus sp. TaxID=543037 RepID=UPI0025D6F7BD|nr:DNA gyrase inhibitor YacG [uncultured Rhodoblastus sp.]